VRIMKRNTNKQEREETRELFHNGSFSIEELASRYGKSERTIYRWVSEDSQDPMPEVPPVIRDQQSRRTYSPEILALIEQFKKELPQRSAITIKRLLEKKYPNHTPSLSTIRRHIRDKGLTYKNKDQRNGYIKFERSRANDLWQIDIAGVQTVGHLEKVYLIALLDDHSRFIVSAEYFKDQKGLNVIKIIRNAIMAYGRPNQILADNGTQFKNLIGELGTKYTKLLESLGIKPIFAKPRHPETKGKLERWFGTVKQMFLGEARHKIKNTPGSTLADLNRMLNDWVEWYNNEKSHRSLPENCAPFKRFLYAEDRIYRPLQVKVNWNRWLHEVEQRKVNKYNEILYKTQKFQLPPGFSGTKVDIVEYDDKIEIYHKENLIITHAYNVPIVNKPKLRKITRAGIIMYKGKPHTIDYKLAGKTVEVQEINEGKNLLVYLNGKLLITIDL
jgi:putative transposase